MGAGMRARRVIADGRAKVTGWLDNLEHGVALTGHGRLTGPSEVEVNGERFSAERIFLNVGGRALIPTGIAIALPEGYAGFVLPRSGLALRHGVTCLNTPGLIDSGYRDELKVLLVNTDANEEYRVERGDRIAQLVIQPVEQARFVVVEELAASERGLGGFGHSGR